MYRENFTIVNGIEFCDYSFMCMTGGMPPLCLEIDLYGESDYDWFNEEIIGAIDAPDFIPAGGFEFIDNPIMTGIFAQMVRRYQFPKSPLPSLDGQAGFGGAARET